MQKINLPPQAIEVEVSILATCLTDMSMCRDILELLSTEDFYRTGHQKIFQAIAHIYFQDNSNDISLILERLKDVGELETAGGAVYLAKLMDEMPVVNHEASCRVLKEKAVLRRTIQICNAMTKKCYEGGEDAGDQIDKFQGQIHDLRVESTPEKVHKLSDLIISAEEEYLRLHENKGKVTGVPTGYSGLDHKTCGLQKTDLIIFAARPGVGKTSLAINLARNAAREDVGVLIFSLEMAANQLRNRLVSMESGLDGHKFRSGNFAPTDWTRIENARAKLYNLPIFIDDQANINVYEMKRRTRKLAQKNNIGIVIIDYLQLIQGDNPQNRNLELGAMTRALKIMAKELDIPVLVLSQLNRKLEDRSDKHPKLSDLRESGNIEQDADVVMFIYRPGVHGDPENYIGHTELMVSKQRNGPLGVVGLVWNPITTKFSELTRMEE